MHTSQWTPVISLSKHFPPCINRVKKVCLRILNPYIFSHELLSRVSPAGQVCEGQGMRAFFRQQTSWKASACCQDLRRAGSVSRVVAAGRADQRTRAVTRAAAASLSRRASRSRWCTRGGRWCGPEDEGSDQSSSGFPEQESIPIKVVHERGPVVRHKYNTARNTTELPAKASTGGSESPRLERAASEPPNKFAQRLNLSKPP